MATPWTKHDWDVATDPDPMLAEATRRRVARTTLVVALVPLVRLSFAGVPHREQRHLDALATIVAAARSVDPADLGGALDLAKEMSDDVYGNSCYDPHRFVADAVLCLGEYLLGKPSMASFGEVTANALAAICNRVSWGAAGAVSFDHVSDDTGDTLSATILVEARRRMAALLRRSLPWARVVRARSA